MSPTCWSSTAMSEIALTVTGVVDKSGGVNGGAAAQAGRGGGPGCGNSGCGGGG